MKKILFLIVAVIIGGTANAGLYHRPDLVKVRNYSGHTWVLTSAKKQAYHSGPKDLSQLEIVKRVFYHNDSNIEGTLMAKLKQMKSRQSAGKTIYDFKMHQKNDPAKVCNFTVVQPQDAHDRGVKLVFHVNAGRQNCHIIRARYADPSWHEGSVYTLIVQLDGSQ